MTTRQHVRSGSYGRKTLSPLTKSSRPAMTSKRSSVPSGNLAMTKQPSRPSSKSGPIDDGEAEDMASFLQFCATCEKQIVTPTITVLYCSESCRRRDSSKPASINWSPPVSPRMTSSDYGTATIVPRRSPTVLRPLSATFSELSLYELSSTQKLHFEMLDDSTFGMPSESRPYIQRTSSSEQSTILPSLVHSPASSYGTTTSAIDNARPLPRKHSCTTHRGIDLVCPVMALTPCIAEPRRKSTPPDDSQRQRKAH